MTDMDIFLRLGAAAVTGILLGLDREVRGFAAGTRTHGMVSLSSAVITISALLLSDNLREMHNSLEADPLRVIQGLAQAIGFIGAGAIFVAKGDVHNLTSAANIWLAAAVGIAAGAGQFTLVWMSVSLGVIMLTGVRLIERRVPGSTKAADD